MNVEDYIATGILDGYVLGSLSEQEVKEVECMAHIYPEIATELSLSIAGVEEYARLHSVPPPSDLRAAILEKAKKELPPIVSNKEEETPVVSMNASDANSKPGWGWKAVAAAAVIVLSIGAFQFFVLKKEASASALALEAKEKTVGTLQTELQGSQIQLAEAQTQLDQFINPSNSRIVPLNAAPGQSEDMFASIAWNTTSHQVHIAPGSLPTLDASKQYQLWAIVDGAPVDLGVFDPSDQPQMMQLKSVAEPQAFAITVEKRGGVPSPTMEAMVVIGNV